MDTDTLDQRFSSIVLAVVAALVVFGFLVGAAMASGQNAVSTSTGPGWTVFAGVGVLLLTFAAAGLAAVVVYRDRMGTDGSADGSAGEALEELRTAYARGDVGEEEFERRRERLERDV